MSEPAKRQDRVLVVDDSPETLSFLMDALENAGLMVLVATDGAAALASLEQITPDVILLDAVMPGLNGFETCRRIKQNKLVAHVPVIFMTALSETEHVVEGLKAGGVDYVTKPTVVDELLARIKVHLANARLAQGARNALDVIGRCLAAVDSDGALLWSTPQAEELLALFRVAPDAPLSEALRQGLNRLRLSPPGGSNSIALPAGPRTLEFSYIGETQPKEFLFRLTESSPGAREQILRDAYGVTEREAEVLIWIAAGKSNRDIGEILDISARTVNKHLEQIFVKLGVENRASAASMAVQALALRG
ncbi:MAG TPA: response regulator [Stellaceae bacterium]|jgi:DNA-binding response OmpR family regulator/DNA-binding CsgD family transcriptional regulator|nr:response regulator [Stellaceae bacterium]